MTYRDSREQCPRCHVALVDARAARGCEQCGGLFVEEPVLSEMVLKMLPPQPHGRLLLAVLQRAGERLPCPTCGDAMHSTEIHGVELDRCPKHGIWFDRPELEVALRRVADPALPSPLETRTVMPEPAPSTPIAEVPQKPWPTTFIVREPYAAVREVKLNTPIVRVGRLPSADLRLEDVRVARMHAVIELNGLSDVTVFDLGSSEGTFVNGTPVTKGRVQHGDELQFGATTVTIQIGR